jgi:hypothetical protein
MEQRAAIRFFTFEGLKAENIHAELEWSMAGKRSLCVR